MRFFETTVVETKVKEFHSIPMALEMLHTQYLVMENTIEIIETKDWWIISAEVNGTVVKDILDDFIEDEPSE